MDKLKVGVIGCGVGRFHVAGYSKLPNVEVAALAGKPVRLKIDMRSAKLYAFQFVP